MMAHEIPCNDVLPVTQPRLNEMLKAQSLDRNETALSAHGHVGYFRTHETGAIPVHSLFPPAALTEEDRHHAVDTQIGL
jgi:hypothetical protein